MTQDNFNNDAENAAAEASAEETLDALNGGNEMSFVATGETKKPINRTSLVLFGILAIGGVGLYLMHLRTGPQSATAAPTDTANKTINQFLSGGQSNIKLMETMLRSTEKVVQQFNQYPSVKQVPLGSLQTNPFRVTGGSSEDADDATNKRKLAEQRQVVLKSFQTLQLQSIMAGTHKACMINNTMVEEGQQIGQVVIEKISSGSVVVKSGNYRFELKMQK